MTLTLLVSLVFAAYAAFELFDLNAQSAGRGGLREVMWWACLAVFGSFSVFACGELLRPTSLIVREAGIELQGLWARPMVPWRDISEFVIFQQAQGGFVLTHLGYRLVAQGRGKHPGGWNRLFAYGRYDRWLMSGMGPRPAAIFELLDQRHRAALSRTP